jgi:hypothetical protein
MAACLTTPNSPAADAAKALASLCYYERIAIDEFTRLAGIQFELHESPSAPGPKVGDLVLENGKPLAVRIDDPESPDNLPHSLAPIATTRRRHSPSNTDVIKPVSVCVVRSISSPSSKRVQTLQTGSCEVDAAAGPLRVLRAGSAIPQLSYMLALASHLAPRWR